jgi:anti-anti-sigma factor
MIETKQIDSETLIIRPGRVLDNNNAHEVMHAVEAAIKDGKRFIVGDMALVEFLSSAGVGSLISSLSVLGSNGGSLVLYNLSEKILHVLEVLDLHDYMPMESSYELALARCRSRQTTDKPSQN